MENTWDNFEAKNTSENFFALTIYPIFTKAYLRISKRPGAFFLLIPIFKYLKKGYLRIWKILERIFLLIRFFRYLKKHTYECQNTWDNFFAHTLFKIFKKVYLRIWKFLEQYFCSYPVSNSYKRILTSLKIPRTFFLLIQFLKYLEKHTYESQKYQGNFFTYTLFQIFK